MRIAIHALLFSLVAIQYHIDCKFITCTRTFSKMGCFDVADTAQLQMDDLINDRDPSSKHYDPLYAVDWGKFRESLTSLACRCSALAAQKGYTFMGIYKYAICSAGKDIAALNNFVKNTNKTGICVGKDPTGLGQCDDDGKYDCSGNGAAMYLYDVTAIPGTKAPVVDGGYTKWDEWETCSVTCGKGSEIRRRSCMNPKPSGGGKDCSGLGADIETRSCVMKDCPVDGAFGPWDAWTVCSESCNDGKMYRKRKCDSPMPQNGGKKCEGNDKEEQTCNLGPCPVNPIDGGFTEWTKFTQCSTTCDEGVKTRTRSCTKPSPSGGGKPCVGPRKEEEECKNAIACPVDGGFGQWTFFGVCSKSCNSGSQTKTRKCDNPTPANGGKDCVGDKQETRTCNTHACPVDGKFSEWSKFSKCSKSCKGGVQVRTRKCDNPAPVNGGKACVGDESESQICNDHLCPGAATGEIVCEHNQGKTIQCPKGLVIKINKAMFGRKSKGPCQFGNYDTTSCEEPHALREVQAKCDYRKSCYLQASSLIYGDPCKGIVKYLEVEFQCIAGDQDAHYEITCDNSAGKSITCQGGTKIEIMSASYGRSSQMECRYGKYKSNDCFNINTLPKMKTICDGKHACKIRAHQSIFGEPCYGVSKYLEVTYKCVGNKVMQTHEPTNIFCENQGRRLTCPRGSVLEITYAMYGRTSAAQCPHRNVNDNNCKAVNTLEEAKSKCDGMSTCVLYAKTTVFGDPCPGNYKYMEVRHKCLPGTPAISSQVCQTYSKRITCPAGKVIHVTYAQYGRISSAYCRTGLFDHFNCRAKDGLAIARKQCEGKGSCYFDSSNEIYGDPCPAVNKYLDFKYYCVQSPDPIVKLGAACDNAGIPLRCPASYVIEVTKATYGRTVSGVCRAGNYKHTKCDAKTVDASVKSECEGLQSCDVYARATHYGDPCPGVYKYMIVQYRCIISTPSVHRVVCQHQEAPRITCPANKQLLIQSAFYGRMQTEYCRTGNFDNRNCIEPNSLAILRQQCERKGSCYFEANDMVYGKPTVICPTNTKYLEFKYKCVDSIEFNVQSYATCDNAGHHFRCPRGTVVEIQKAMYGRTTKNICRRHNYHALSCQSSTTQPAISAKCDGMSSCSLVGSVNYYGEPCHGIYKYLKSEYKCVAGIPNIRSVVCQNANMKHITCRAGEVIKIIYANYGRLSMQDCRTGNYHHHHCSAKGALEKVKKICDGHLNCWLDANSAVFGDACPSVMKYLEVKHHCVKSIKSPPVTRAACQNGAVSLTCAATKQRIHILYANYGRTSTNLCKRGNFHDSNCKAQNSLDEVRARCEHQSTCTVHGNDITFGNPCTGIYKYIEVRYECVDGPPTTRKLVCENAVSQLAKCPVGQVLRFEYANYGRITPNWCRVADYKHYSCKQTTSLDDLRKKCEGKEMCYLGSTSGIFGNPCAGVSKYLEAKYYCEPSGAPAEKLNIACQNAGSHIICPTGTVIDVVGANYGRTSEGICRRGKYQVTDCKAPNSLLEVKAKCQGMSRCYVVASDNVYGDPCLGFSKYLEVNYKCIPGNGYKRNVLCEEHRSQTISCPKGQGLSITEANFGRTSKLECRAAKRSFDIGNCVEPKTLSIMKKLCDGHNNCYLDASTRLFGEPCKGFSKYLEVKYECKASATPTPTSLAACENRRLAPSCKAGEMIEIVAAEYGRQSLKFCRSGKYTVTNCISPTVLADVKKKCDGLRSCSYHASSKELGDPCPGVHKYGVVTYKCVTNQVG